MFLESPLFFVAEENNEIIGVSRGKYNKISNLFVKNSSHRKGVGRRLVEVFEAKVKKLGTNEIKIRSTLYASPFYQKVGYKKTTGIRNYMGLKVYPMKKILK